MNFSAPSPITYMTLIIFISDKPCGAGDTTSSSAASGNEKIQAYVTILPAHNKLMSITSYIKSREETKSDEHLVLDSLFILLQVISLIFALAEKQKQIESISAGDLVVSVDSDCIPTVYCHMISVKKTCTNFNLICEKLRLLVIQLTHTCERLTRVKQFKTVEDLIQNSADAGDLKTIALIIQYLLWGPKEDEIKVMSSAENRKQAFELWLHLSRATLLNQLVFQPLDRLKMCMMIGFWTNTSGNELFKITKLLSTY